MFELGARHLSAGFAGESSPRCKLTFGPEDSRRVGDYRRWLPGFEFRDREKKNGYNWGEDHELWRLDLREIDLGLVKDKVERAVREAFTRHLLSDAKSKRLILIIPSIMPHPLLSCILNIMFIKFHALSITLLSHPIVCLAASGCRSGLVVDIGWSETIVTGLYEYREISQSRTTRAMKAVTKDMAHVIQLHSRTPVPDASRLIQEDSFDGSVDILFEHAEQVTTRMAWCQSSEQARSNTIPSDLVSSKLDTPSIAGNTSQNPGNETGNDPFMTIPSPSPTRQPLQIPFSHFAHPVETALFAKAKSVYDLDDHDQPLPSLIYKALLSLPHDVRGICMSRIIITGGGSHIPGLKPRLLDEVSALIKTRNWDPVQGKAADERRRRLQEISSNRPAASAPTQAETLLPDKAQGPPASQILQTSDPILEKLRRDQAKDSKPFTAGTVRGVETLGAWAGGSLLAGLKVKGVVEIDGDAFLQHGFAGARREADVSITQQRQSYGAGISRTTGGGERSGWTLGAWA